MTTAMAEMPKYKSHKEVWALKIKRVVGSPSDPTWTIIPDDERYGPIVVDNEWVEKHSPESGGYYIAYKDGYKSYSPAEAFESGYTLIQ